MPQTTLRRDAGTPGLLLASIGGMVGSGWLFSALNAARIAGPASLISWAIGGAAVLLLAFVFAELSTLFPRPGAVIVFPQLCFGPLAAQIFSWINFLAYVSVAPVEAVAVISYANNLWPGLTTPTTGLLTLAGLGCTAALMALFIVINMLAIRLVLRINNIITGWKLLVPALTIICLLAVHFRAANFTQFGFAPAGAGGVLAAVSGSGIIFTFLGFRQAIELAGESADPTRNLPRAILGSLLFCLLLYLGLQTAFIAALSPADLEHGWAHLSFHGISGPFAGLASGLGLIWLAVTLYADAAISPGGTGIIYATTAARVIFAAADENLAPRFLTFLSPAGVPTRALALSFFAGLLFLAPLPNWRELVTYLSSIGVLAYGIGPVVLICLRDSLPESAYPRPFRLAAAPIIAPAAFIVANLVVYWAGPAVANHLFGGLAIAFALFCLANLRRLQTLAWRGAAWIAPYFAGLWLITYMHAGIVAITLFSLAILQLARVCALQDPAQAKERLSKRSLF